MSLPIQMNTSEDGAQSASSPADEVILATAGYDHTIKFWQAHTGKCLRTLQHADSQVNALEISSDGQLLAAAGHQHIRMFDVYGNSAGPVVNYEGVRKNVMAVGFHEADQWMYTGGEDGTAKIWDLRMRNLRCQCNFSANAPVNTVVLHPNQHELVIGDQNGTVHIWDIRANVSESYTPEPGTSIQCVAIDSRAKYIAAVTNKCKLFVMSTAAQQKENGTKERDDEDTEANKVPIGKRLNLIKEILAHKRYALRCKFSPDSSVLVTSSADQRCKVWRTSDFELVSEMRAPETQSQRWIWDLAFSADSQYLFTASSDNLARLWSMPTPANNYKYEVKRVYEENGHQKAVTSLAFRDGSGHG